MKTLRRLRQDAARRRFDFKPPVASQITSTRIIMTDRRLRIDRASAIDGRLHVNAAAETPVAFDDGIGCIDAVDDDGYAGAAWNHEVETFAGNSRQRRSDQNRQCKCLSLIHISEPT